MEQDLYFASDAQAKKFEARRKVGLIFVYALLAIAALFTLVPFYWMIATSFKNAEEVTRTPATFIPLHPTFDNYLNVFAGDNAILLRYIGNTLLVGVLTTVFQVVITILAAFAFSRLEFKGRDAIFGLLLTTMMVPGEMMVMTNFTTIANLNWLDTYQALVVPFVASVFYIFFLRQNFKQIPNELYYAAKVDGNSDFKYLWKVMIPIARSSIITITILAMIGSWNAYIWPRTVCSDHDMRLVTDGLLYLFQSDTGGTSDHIIMAGTTVVSLPLLIAFICFKKYIMRGVARSGIKG